MFVLAAEARGVDFDTQVMPVFTKAGCNSGACHGAAIGRGGFRLSLYGGDPAADYENIVHELEGRRINLARPTSSLLLAKPTERLEHGGGQRFESDSSAGKLLAAWIAGGAPRLKARKLVGFEATPRREVILQPGARVRLRVSARFDDGAQADVTEWTVFTAADADAVKVDPETAEAAVLRRGQNIVIARYLDRVVPLELVVPLGDRAVDLAQQRRRNFIDDEIQKMLETLRVSPSPSAEDAAFLRRVSLDLTGRLPTPQQAVDFVADKRSPKRDELVDRLLRSKEFVEYWTYKLANLLRVRDLSREPQVAAGLHRWLSERIAGDTGYDEQARELLTALGDSHVHAPAAFYRLTPGPREQAEYVSELFLGVRLRCANCHNHPLDRWTQDDYHGLAAVFARLETGREVRLGGRGQVTHPRTGEPALPRIPGVRFLETQGDGRNAFAQWLTSKVNPYFARALVNRLWKSLMGRGLIEPVDDLSDTNPGTHPELLRKLADDFVQNGCSIRHTLRRIATSAAYERAATKLPANQADDRWYSHALQRPLEAEVLMDAICDVTGVPETFGDLPGGTRAVALVHPGVPAPSLDILGRCDRRDSCDGDESRGGGLSAKLHLLNGPLINAKITAARGQLRRMMDDRASNEDIVNAFYLRALGRKPREEEASRWKKSLSTAAGGAARREALEDFVWSLLNCREFRTNH
jgi:hypothetical protein